MRPETQLNNVQGELHIKWARIGEASEAPNFTESSIFSELPWYLDTFNEILILCLTPICFVDHFGS